jgi:hypothetical protein
MELYPSLLSTKLDWKMKRWIVSNSGMLNWKPPSPSTGFYLQSGGGPYNFHYLL